VASLLHATTVSFAPTQSGQTPRPFVCAVRINGPGLYQAVPTIRFYIEFQPPACGLCPSAIGLPTGLALDASSGII